MNQQIQTDPNMPITLTLTINDVNKVLAGLGYLPFRDVAALLEAIKQQGDAQLMEWVSKNTPAPDAPAETPAPQAANEAQEQAQ